MFKNFKNYVAKSYKNFTCYSSFRQVIINYTYIFYILYMYIQLNKLIFYAKTLVYHKKIFLGT